MCATHAKESSAGVERAPACFALDGSRLTLEALDAALEGTVHLTVSEDVWAKVEAAAARIQQLCGGSQAVYGVNTGIGPLCRTRIPADQLQALQRNLILSHAVGVGPPAPPQVVRWMMLLKAYGLAHGASGISRRTLQILIDLLKADALPVIPMQGSLGASGDLAPLAHMVLPMIGEGQLQWRGGSPAPASTVLKLLGLAAMRLGPKEGLALINGTQFMSAIAATVLVRARRLVRHCDIIAAMSLEGIAGSVKPFDERLHALRPHRGAIESAANVRSLLAESDILPSHADCDRVQDPYSIRCVPQVHGASRDALRHAAQIVEDEINSVTDNPVIVEGGDVVSGGLFHGQPLALAMDYAAMALAELGSISERRSYLLLEGVGGLPKLLIPNAGVNSGLMIPHYVAAALVSENKGLCFPASVDSIPTGMGQEDHVSMGARSAVKCLQVLENVEQVLAIEQLLAAQALDFRAPLRAGVGPRG